MRLSVKGLGLAAGIIWAGGILCVGLVNLWAPPYGAGFLAAISSIYPGFHNSRHFLDVLVGTGYGLVDGGIGGWIFAWLYNCFAGKTVAS
ncbi:MAG: hypothetical protein M1423_10290 [Acidobacteria bacterium]|nr:hypothetical protein [Acidobacteriota bacterium]